ncbi:MAG: hypothetical protein II079_01325, partial [Oscillospiraceae bacterium]|nr:hypothetical protein [Oscillospiraceae bacterium]
RPCRRYAAWPHVRFVQGVNSDAHVVRIHDPDYFAPAGAKRRIAFYMSEMKGTLPIVRKRPFWLADRSYPGCVGWVREGIGIPSRQISISAPRSGYCFS